jgi:hypothetical protein
MMYIGDPTRSAGKKSDWRKREKSIAPRHSYVSREPQLPGRRCSVASLIEGGFAAKT